MDLYLLWILVGFALVIAELIAGTFYLLVIGLGAFAAAVVAWLGGNVLWQAVVGSAIALGGMWLVHHWHEVRRQRDAGHSNMLDRGQAVVLEGWTDEPSGTARVRYRGTSWDARIVAATERPPPGATLYIVEQEGNTLVVATTPPAR